MLEISLADNAPGDSNNLLEVPALEGAKVDELMNKILVDCIVGDFAPSLSARYASFEPRTR